MSLKALTGLIVATLGLMACNPLGKMAKNSGTIQYALTPDPMEMHGDSVNISVTGKFPPNYFHRKATVEVVPVIKGADGSVVKELESIKLIGEQAEGEGRKINYANGGSFNYSVGFPYEKSMENVTLEATTTASYKTKSKSFDPIKVADGTITTPLWVQGDDRPILGKDNFTKVIPRSINAEINYLVNSSQVRGSELNDDDIKALKAFVEEGVEKEFVWKGVSSTAYASPDGEISLNENLANDRASSGSRSLANILRRAKVEAGAEDGFYSNTGKGEDWSGFKDLMQKSEIKDKELIIRILSLYSDNEKREQEIKNLAATYTEVRDQILPPLRRTQLVLSAEERSKSDEEISRLAASAPDSLNIEEILYAATLTDKLDEKLSIYRSAARVHAQDWRGPNNTGYILLLQNKVADAKTEFEKAAGLGESPVIKNNLGVVARLQGDRDRARELYNQSKAAGSDVNYNIGILDIINGNYNGAVSNFGTNKTFNVALAQALNGNTKGALDIIEASDDKATARGYYLKAIIGARTDNKDLVINNLKSAINKESVLKEKAKIDAEFLKYRGNSDFDALVN